MHNGLPKEYLKRFPEYFKKRKTWTVLVLYDDVITVFVLKKEDHKNEIRISSVKRAVSRGIKAGRIVNSRIASREMAYLLKSVSEDAGIKDNRVLLGLDTPPLLLTQKQWADDSSLKSPCDEEKYRRILHNIVRESSYDTRLIMEIIPMKITVDGRRVEEPYGITGQMHMDNVLVSLSYQDRKDFERCLNGIRYRCESYFSGFQNLCSAFSGAAEQNQHVLLVDMKNNSTDVIMFQGDQPVRMKCYKQGLESILIESLSSVLNIDRADAIACMKKYYQNSGDKYAEIIGEDELPACSMGLKCWEIHEIIMGQLNSFIEMEGGISNLVMQLQAESNAAPRKLIITGEGACIPEIHRLFEKRISIKTEVRKRISPRAFANLQTTAYGMALTIAHDAGAAILQ